MTNFAKPLCAALVLTTAPCALLAQTSLRMVLPVSGSGDALAELAESYNAAQSDAKVTVQRFPAGTGYGQGLLTQLQSGAGPDLMFVNGGYGSLEALMPMADAGQLADLSGREWADMVPESARDAYYKGEALYGLPLSLVSVGTVFNGPLMADKGIDFPADEDEMFAACAAAKEAGTSYSGVAGPFPFYLVETIAVNKVYVDTPDWNAKRRAGEVSFADTPGWTETFETYKKMADEGCFPAGYEAADISTLFGWMAGGQTLSGIGPVTLAGAVTGMNPDVKMSVGPWPAGDETVGIGYFNDAIAVNGASENLGATLAFVDWIAQPENQRAFASVAGGTAVVDVAQGEYSPMVGGLAEYYDKDIVPMPHNGWTSPEVRDALNRGASAYLSGQMTVQEVLDGMDTAWEQ